MNERWDTRCPRCRVTLTLHDCNSEARVDGKPRNVFYEYRHEHGDGCGALVIPGITHVRCWHCCVEWVPGRCWPKLCHRCDARGERIED